MNKQFGFKHLDVYQRATGILDSLAGHDSEGHFAGILTAKASEAVCSLVEGLETWPAEQKKEALFRARKVFHQLHPLVETAGRCGILDKPEAVRMEGELDTVSKMLYGLAKSVGQPKESEAA